VSLFSSITGAFRRVWRAVKAVARIVVRVTITVVAGILSPWDLLFGFVAWPPKKLRYQVFILSDSKGPLINLANQADAAALRSAIDFFKKTFKDRFNVNVIAYGKPDVQVIEGTAPTAALDVSCGGGALSNEFGEAGEFFADHLAGWNVIPISLGFPITIFIVRSMTGTSDGCSIGPLTDYTTMTPSAVRKLNVMAHEAGHSCNLWHSGAHSNLMWPDPTRGNQVHWWQRNLLRISRHVRYF
jgi:hypothetical protein